MAINPNVAGERVIHTKKGKFFECGLLLIGCLSVGPFNLLFSLGSDTGLFVFVPLLLSLRVEILGTL